MNASFEMDERSQLGHTDLVVKCCAASQEACAGPAEDDNSDSIPLNKHDNAGRGL